MNVRDEFLAMLTDALEDTGVDLSESKEVIAGYMAERSAHLSTIAHEVGFGRAVTREANSIAMRAGLEVSSNANAVHSRLVGFIGGALRIAAIALL